MLALLLALSIEHVFCFYYLKICLEVNAAYGTGQKFPVRLFSGRHVTSFTFHSFKKVAQRGIYLCALSRMNMLSIIPVDGIERLKLQTGKV